MPVVARIEVPPPEPFVEGEDGAEAKGAGYRFVAPRTATEPLVFQAADGHALFWTPTELVYGDADGHLDYIAGSAPASFTVRGRSVHYPRTFPASEEVHVALPEGRKYWLYLYEPPRLPGAHLSGDVWFGVSGMVGGIPLPSGRAQAMESFGFQFQPVYAEDTMGARVEGWYEVVDTDQGQQLFICVPADWLLDPDRVYPVKIDPTVVVTSSWYNARYLFRLSNGGLAAVVIGKGVYFSYDNGQTWTAATWQGDSMPSGSYRMVVDEYDRLWSFAAVRGGLRAQGVFKVWSINGTTITLLAQASTLYYEIRYGAIDEVVAEELVVRDNKAFGVFAYYVRFNAAEDGSLMYYEWAKMAATATFNPSTNSISTTSSRFLHGYEYVEDGSSPFGFGYSRSATSITSDGTAYTISVCYGIESSLLKGLTKQGTSSATAHVQGISGLDRGWWLDKGGWRLLRTNSGGTRVEYASNVPSAIVYPEYAFYVPSERAIAVLGANSNKQLVMALYYPDTDQWSDVNVREDISVRTYAPSHDIKVTSVPILDSLAFGVPILFNKTDTSDTNLYFEHVLFNEPPFAPTNLTRPAFDATDDAEFTWVHFDPNGDRQAMYHLQILLDGVVVYDTGEVQSPNSQHILPGGTLENGRTYQWRVRTADQAGEWSPWSDYAVFQTGPKPQATILHPTAGATVSTSEVTVEWSVANQSAATVRLYDEAGQTVLQEHEVTTPGARAKTITGLENNTSYQVSVQPVSSIGVVGDEVFSGPFTVQYTPPPKPIAGATEQSGFIRVTIINPAPTGDEPEVTHNDIYRREPGQGWVRIATGIAPDGTYDDYAVGSGVSYEYRARAVGANGTYTDSDPVSAAVTFDEWRFSPVDGQPEIRFRFDSSVTWRPEEDVQVPRTMSRYQRTYRNPSYPRVATIQARFRDGEDGLTVREQRERLLRYIEQGVVGWLRGPHGDCWRGVLLEPEVLPSTHFARETVTCVFRETREAP